MGIPHRPVAIAFALMALAACSVPEANDGSSARQRTPTSSATAPNAPGDAPGPVADATLTGRVVGRDGAPLAGMPVTVIQDRSDTGVDAALTAIFTFGIACVATDACDTDDRVVDSATSGTDGRFELILPRAYLPGYETDEDWVVQVGRAPAPGELTGPSSSFELEVNTRVQESPDLAMWDATPAVTQQGALLHVDIPPLTGGPALTEVSPRFVNDAGAVVWGVHGRTVDPRVLEDQSTRVVSSGSADVVVRHIDGRTIYHQSVVTPTVAYAGTMTPISRGAACAADAGLVGCPFTDGDLVTLTESVLEPVTVDLGSPTELGLVIVRGSGLGAEADLVIEGSVDGTAWTWLSHRRLDGADGWSAGPVRGDGIPSVRYLRVGAGERSLDLAEISAWPPTAAERTSASREPGDGGPSGSAIAKVAAAVLAAAAGGVLLAVRRRVGR